MRRWALASITVDEVSADPIEAEFGAALFAAMLEMAGEDYEDALSPQPGSSRPVGRPARSGVSLAQALPSERSKIAYVYDFGDEWRHEILVEKVFDPDESVTYPRCTGGRRAAPPEDCGGISSYADLLDVLADPAHPQLADSLEWLGLASAAEFDPTTFDAPAITKALTGLA